jgi:hypothetical protein
MIRRAVPVVEAVLPWGSPPSLECYDQKINGWP